MATTTNKPKTASSRTTKPKTTSQSSAPKSQQPAQPKPKLVAKDIDLHQYITVRNGFQGTLVYVSPKTGERFVWPEFGSEQEMELLELKGAKNSAKKFFINNWFMFDDEWVLDFLGVRQYYKYALKVEDFDKIFEMSPTEIASTIGEMSKGQKRSVAYRATQLISEGAIDSNRVIKALEDSLGVELLER